MESLIGTAVGVVISLLAIAMMWGKLSNMVDNNAKRIDKGCRDIKEIEDHCEKLQQTCQARLHSRLDQIFAKLDVIQTDMTRLAVQVAKMESKLEE